MYCPFIKEKCKEKQCRIFYAGDCAVNIAVDKLQLLASIAEDMKHMKYGGGGGKAHEQQAQGQRWGA